MPKESLSQKTEGDRGCAPKSYIYLHCELEVKKLSPMEAEEEEFYDKKPLKGSTSGESLGSQGLSKGKGWVIWVEWDKVTMGQQA